MKEGIKGATIWKHAYNKPPTKRSRKDLSTINPPLKIDLNIIVAFREVWKGQSGRI
jgi:hypothetical protein